MKEGNKAPTALLCVRYPGRSMVPYRLPGQGFCWCQYLHPNDEGYAVMAAELDLKEICAS